jgi:hypothetical protein
VVDAGASTRLRLKKELPMTKRVPCASLKFARERKTHCAQWREPHRCRRLFHPAGRGWLAR